MDHSQVIEKVKGVIAKKLEINEELVADTSTFEELGVDSLDAVEIAMELEETFGIEIPDEDANKIVSVQAAVEYIERVLK